MYKILPFIACIIRFHPDFLLPLNSLLDIDHTKWIIQFKPVVRLTASNKPNNLLKVILSYIILLSVNIQRKRVFLSLTYVCLCVCLLFYLMIFIVYTMTIQNILYWDALSLVSGLPANPVVREQTGQWNNGMRGNGEVTVM